MKKKYKNTLFFFAYAGCNNFALLPMMKKLDINAHIEILSLSKKKGCNIKTVEEMVQYYVSEIVSVNSEQMIFWGHSFGGNIAFEVIKSMDKAYQRKIKSLKCFILTSSYPPNRLHKISHFNSKADEMELIVQLKAMSYIKYGFEMDSIKTIVLDRFRNDLMLLEKYIPKFEKAKEYDFPTHLIYGTEDIGIEVDYVSEWEQFIENLTTSKMKGGHFFINQSENLLNIRNIITKYFS